MSGVNLCPSSIDCDDDSAKQLKATYKTCSQWKKDNPKDEFIQEMITPNPLTPEPICPNRAAAEALYDAMKDCMCGLSTGAIVGIVIGSLAFIAIVVFIVLRMRKKKGKRRKK